MTDVESLDGLRALVAEAEAAGTAEARWRAVAAVDPTLVERIIHGGATGIPSGGFSASGVSQVAAVGTGASPGVGTGVVCLTTEDVLDAADRSEERRVGKECRSRWSPYH